MNDSVIIFCPKEDFPTEIGAKLTWTPPPPSPHRPEGQTCYASGLGHYNLFQISPQSFVLFFWRTEGLLAGGGLGFKTPALSTHTPPILTRARGLMGIRFFNTLVFGVLEGFAEPSSADCGGSAEPAADIAGADPAAEFFKVSTKPSLLSQTVKTVDVD